MFAPCPNCNYTRQEKDSVVPAWQCPQCGVAYAKAIRNASEEVSRFVRVFMVSGREVCFTKVKLYDQNLLNQIDQLRQAAARNFAGCHSNIGFWGSWEFVLGASVLSGLVSSARSSQMQQEGIEQLKHLIHLTEKLRRTTRFVPVSSIRQIEQPDLTLWYATFNFNETVAEFGHPQSNYVRIGVAQREITLCWDKIEGYELVEGEHPTTESQASLLT